VLGDIGSVLVGIDFGPICVSCMYDIHIASLWSKSAASDYTAPKLPFATVAFGLMSDSG